LDTLECVLVLIERIIDVQISLIDESKCKKADKWIGSNLPPLEVFKKIATITLCKMNMLWKVVRKSSCAGTPSVQMCELMKNLCKIADFLSSDKLTLPFLHNSLLENRQYLTSGFNFIFSQNMSDNPATIEALVHLLNVVEALAYNNCGVSNIGLPQMKYLLADFGAEKFHKLEERVRGLVENPVFPVNERRLEKLLDSVSSLRQLMCSRALKGEKTTTNVKLQLPAFTTSHVQHEMRQFVAAHRPQHNFHTGIPQNENCDAEADLQELGEKLMTNLTNQKFALKSEITAMFDAHVKNGNDLKKGDSPNKNEVLTFSARAKKKLTSFAKRSHHLVTRKDPQGMGRPFDLFRHRKQNTSRPPSMHVDDFVRADHEEQEKRENFNQISKFIDSARKTGENPSAKVDKEKSPENYNKKHQRFGGPQKHFHGNNKFHPDHRNSYHGNSKGYFPHSRRSGDSQHQRYPGNQRGQQPMKSKHSRTFTR